MSSSVYRCRGIALLTTLLVVSIASIIAVSLVKRQWVDIRKTQNTLLLEQSWLYAQGVEAWAMGRLEVDNKKNKIDSTQDGWSQPIKPTQVTGGELAATVTDVQGKLNINGLLASGTLAKKQQDRFRRLLVALDLNPELADAVLDWLDADSEARYPEGAEETFYTSKTPAYRPPNQAIVDISELRLVKGFTEAIYSKLAPHIAALPPNTKINVNTATEWVLRSLGAGLTSQDAQAIIETRDETPFEEITTFLQHPALAGIAIDGEGLSLASDYFIVKSSVRVGSLSMRYQSIIQRENQAKISVIQRIKQGKY